MILTDSSLDPDPFHLDKTIRYFSLRHQEQLQDGWWKCCRTSRTTLIKLSDKTRKAFVRIQDPDWYSNINMSWT